VRSNRFIAPLAFVCGMVCASGIAYAATATAPAQNYKACAGVRTHVLSLQSHGKCAKGAYTVTVGLGPQGPPGPQGPAGVASGVGSALSGQIPATPQSNYVLTSVTLPSGYWDVSATISLYTFATSTNYDEIVNCELASAAGKVVAQQSAFIGSNEDRTVEPIATFVSDPQPDMTTWNVRCTPVADPQSPAPLFPVNFNVSVQAIQVAGVTGYAASP
jgi:hypothetical protein